MSPVSHPSPPQSEGVYGNVTQLLEWQLHLLPLDKDLLTMDEPSAFRELKAHQDPSCLMRAARAIMQLQMIYGLVPRIAGKGRAAEVRVRVSKSPPPPPGASQPFRERTHPSPFLTPPFSSLLVCCPQAPQPDQRAGGAAARGPRV